MKKTARQEKIIEIVSNNDIETQNDLAVMLNDAGFKATQATVSRDIKELHLEKRAKGKGSYYFYPEGRVMNQNKYLRVFNDALVKIESAGNIVVIKTASGMAMAVAAALDSLGMREVVGTIAGDDTIMCATHSDKEASAVVSHIKKMLKGV